MQIKWPWWLGGRQAMLERTATRHTRMKIALREAMAASGIPRESLEERVENIEVEIMDIQERKAGGLYMWGMVIASILAWSDFHSVLATIGAGLLSWLWVVLYVITHWAHIKFI
jgi:hypothetical protein